MVAQSPTDDSDEPTQADHSYPRPPTVVNVETRGTAIRRPRFIDVTISYWPRGHDDFIEATVAFATRGETAELRDISGQGSWTKQLAAAAKAEEVVREHPAIDEVVGVENLFNSEKTWIDECTRMNEEDEASE